MENESPRTYYTLNLDPQRMLVVAGIVVSLVGGAFMLGAKWQEGKRIPAMEKNLIQDLSIQDAKDDERLAAALTTGKTKLPVESEEHVLPPIEHKTMVESPLAKTAEKNVREEIPVKKDPFIQGPGHTKERPQTGRKILSATTRRLYTIQVAAFKREADARKLVYKLKKIGVSSRVEKGRLFFLVRAGRSSSRASLQGDLKKIESRLHLKPLIVKKNFS